MSFYNGHHGGGKSFGLTPGEALVLAAQSTVLSAANISAKFILADKDCREAWHISSQQKIPNEVLLTVVLAGPIARGLTDCGEGDWAADVELTSTRLRFGDEVFNRAYVYTSDLIWHYQERVKAIAAKLQREAGCRSGVEAAFVYAGEEVSTRRDLHEGAQP